MNFTKTMKRAVSIALTASFVLSTGVFAAPGYISGGVRYLCSDIGSNPAELQALNASIAKNGMDNLIVDLGSGLICNYKAFVAANPGNVNMTTFIEYAKAHKAPVPPGTLIATPTNLTGVGNPDPEAVTQSAITVSSLTAVTKTTVTVKLAAVPATAPTTFDFSVAGNTVASIAKGASDDVYILTLGTSLDGKAGVLSVNGATIAYDFTSNPVAVKPFVESVTFVNYREFQVTFNTIVDHPTAADPANYYLEIAEGDASLGLNGVGVLDKGLNLSELNPWFSIPGNISAADVNNKTVVTIRLPENDRFTNVYQNGTGKYGARTLCTELADQGETWKCYCKDGTVNISVRNVKDAAGVRRIDTSYTPMKVLDTTAPDLVTANKVAGGTETPFSLSSGVTLTSDGSDKVNLVYDEPVYDAHWIDGTGLDVSGTDRDVKVYIDGKLVGDSLGKKIAPDDPVKGLHDNERIALDQIMTFDMSANATYESGCRAYLDVKKAVEAAVGTKIGYQAGHTYNVKIIGVTDLAGNIQVPSTVEFNVTVADPSINAVKPAILGIKQVADNIFRVEANEANVTGLFTIANADGEGGTVTQIMPLTTPSGGKFYAYVDVPVAVDGEPDRADRILHDNVIDYDGQDFINRDLKVSDVQWVNNEYEALAFGDNYDAGMMKLQKDIYAPVVVHPTDIIPYGAQPKLTFGVTDVVPQGTESSYKNPVSIMKYPYSNETFDTENLDLKTPDQEKYERYLPVKVSYVDKNGATHGVFVTNLTVRDNNEHKRIIGVPGSISYNGSNLTIDLSGYPDMLDPATHNLIPGVTYTVELPKGYFADPTLELRTPDNNNEQDSQDFINATNASTVKITAITEPATGLDHHIKISREQQFVYDVLYTSEARSYWHGYTSIADTVNFTTAPMPAATDAVPQTSKELITFNNPPDVISVEFTGQIDVNTLKDPNNYTLNGKTLAQLGATSANITYVVNGRGTTDPTDDRQFAIINLPADMVAADGDAQFEVSGVANLAGGKMTPVTTQIALLDNTRPVATSVQVTAQRQIKMTFGEPIQFKAGANNTDAAKNFLVMCGNSQLTVLEATLDPSRDDRMVTLDLGTDIPATGTLTVQVVKNSNNNDIVIQDESRNHNPLNSDRIYNVTR